MPDKTSQPIRVVATAGIALVFVAMLTGTSKEQDDEQDSKADAEADDKTAAADAPSPPEPEVPSSERWTKVELSPAGVSCLLPPGATAPAEMSGNDPSFAGRFFNVILASGFNLNFAQTTGEPTDFARKKKFYEKDANGFEGIVLETEDALVAARNESMMNIGKYWEVSACSKSIGDERMCIDSVGALIDMDNEVSKLSNDEVMQVIAIARSVEPLE